MRSFRGFLALMLLGSLALMLSFCWGCEAQAVTRIDGQQAEVEKHVTPIPPSKTTEDTTDFEVTPSPTAPPVAPARPPHDRNAAPSLFHDAPTSNALLVSDILPVDSEPATTGTPGTPGTPPATSAVTSDTASAGPGEVGLTIPGGAEAKPGTGSKVNGGRLIVPPGATVHFHRTIKTTETEGATATDAKAKGKGASISTSSPQATDKFDSSAPMANIGTDKMGNDTASASGGSADISATLLGPAKGAINVFTILGALCLVGCIGCVIARGYQLPTGSAILPLGIGAVVFITVGVIVGSYPWVALIIAGVALAATVGWVIYKHIQAERGATGTAAASALATAVANHPDSDSILANATAAVAGHPGAQKIADKIDSLLPSMFTGGGGAATAAPAPAATAAPGTLPGAGAGVGAATSPTHTISTTTTSTPVAPLPASPKTP